MIIKGSSRAAPSQLANHLKRADTNERVEVLELQSPHGDLAEALRDWQFLAAGTKGTKGLYHANIDPAEAYAMTTEQWTRSVDVLEEELGLQGQPRAVVLHEKHGRQHIHVVWARTDIDSMTLRSDSQNYKAHERASGRLELEFGHEHVPGKHEKRDRANQEEPPRSDVNHAEWQQAERTGIDPRDRKSHITALFEQSDSGQAFKAALEEAGYAIAQGDRRDFVLVDEQGEVHSLGRQIKGVKAAELRAFMEDIDRATMPTVAEARAQQAERDHAPAPRAPDAPEPQEAGAPVVADNAAEEAEARLRAALGARYEEERLELDARHAAEIETMTAEQDAEAATDRDRFEDDQPERAPEPMAAPRLFARLWQRVKEALSADARRAREAEEARRAAARAAVREQARRDFIANENRRRDLAREDLRARQAEDLRKLTDMQAADLARRLADQERAAQLARAGAGGKPPADRPGARRTGAGTTRRTVTGSRFLQPKPSFHPPKVASPATAARIMQAALPKVRFSRFMTAPQPQPAPSIRAAFNSAAGERADPSPPPPSVFMPERVPRRLRPVFRARHFAKLKR